MLERDRKSTVDWQRLRLAEAWGTLAAAWGVPPAVARVHGYLLACRRSMTERQVREALGLSHRAASIALERTVELGLSIRADGQRIGARGPIGAAYRAVEDDWTWIGRVLAERRATEFEPAIAAVGGLASEIAEESRLRPQDASLAELAGWLGQFAGTLRRLERVFGLVPVLEPHELEVLVAVAAALPERGLVRLARTLADIEPGEVAALADALGRLPSKAVRPALRALAALSGTPAGGDRREDATAGSSVAKTRDRRDEVPARDRREDREGPDRKRAHDKGSHDGRKGRGKGKDAKGK
jgi:DNA-binding transcriptional regulator GbsR (MarR family)